MVQVRRLLPELRQLPPEPHRLLLLHYWQMPGHFLQRSLRFPPPALPYPRLIVRQTLPYLLLPHLLSLDQPLSARFPLLPALLQSLLLLLQPDWSLQPNLPELLPDLPVRLEQQHLHFLLPVGHYSPLSVLHPLLSGPFQRRLPRHLRLAGQFAQSFERYLPLSAPHLLSISLHLPQPGRPSHSPQ